MFAGSLDQDGIALPAYLELSAVDRNEELKTIATHEAAADYHAVSR